MYGLIEGSFRFRTPVPSIIKGFYLRLGALARGAPKQHVIAGLAVEWGIEIDEVHALAFDLIAEDRQVVAVVKGIQSVLGITSRHPGCSPGMAEGFSHFH